VSLRELAIERPDHQASIIRVAMVIIARLLIDQHIAEVEARRRVA
jgi:hypothetical protein